MIGSFFRLNSQRAKSACLLTLAALFSAAPLGALAQSGHAEAGQIGFQPSVTTIMDSTAAFHNGILLWIISIITLVVFLLLAWIVVRYNARANPVASKTTHNTLIEIVWTVAPIIILIVIAVPSFGVLADQETIPDGERKYLGANIFSFGEVEVPAPEVTVKATGVQWSWNYEYVSDEEGGENVGFSSFMLEEDSPPDFNDNPTDRPTLKPNQPRLLAVDYELVVPVDTTVRVQVTAADVLHAFAVPSFGIKIDAVPGRLNETWFNARETGIYYGQCSELCGMDHAFMPIAVRVVSKDDFAAWMEELQANGVASANALLGPIT